VTRRSPRRGEWLPLRAILLVGIAAVVVAGCLFPPESVAPLGSVTVGPPETASVSPTPTTSPTLAPSMSPTPTITVAAPAPCPGSNRNPGASAGRQVTGSSTNWSGYVAAVRRTSVTCVEASWIEPAISCPSSGHRAVAIWIGFDGFSATLLGIPSTKVLVQIGTQAECNNGVASHNGWHEVLPAEKVEVAAPGPVHAGDHLSARILYAGGKFTLSLFDAETSFSFSTTQRAAGAPRRTAEWIVEAPATSCPGSCSPIALPKFDPVRFTNAFTTIAGQRAAINDHSWSNVKLRMIRSGVTRTTTSGLVAGGTSFKVTWVHR
jgi:Peptidase A4 family